jgi:hypothetical protein
MLVVAVVAVAAEVLLVMFFGYLNSSPPLHPNRGARVHYHAVAVWHHGAGDGDCADDGCKGELRLQAQEAAQAVACSHGGSTAAAPTAAAARRR